MMKLVGALSAGALAMTNTLRSRLSTNLKFRFRLRTLMVFIALIGLCLGTEKFESEARPRWRLYAKQAEIHEHRRDGFEDDAMRESHSIEMLEKQYTAYMSIKPANRIRLGIGRAELQRVKVEIARHEKLRIEAKSDAQIHAELARYWRALWW